MSRDFPWDVLGIDATDDRKAIRSAYAAQLKGINPDEDIAGYARLRDARDHALGLAQQGVALAPAPDAARADLPPDTMLDATADPQVDPTEPQDDLPDRLIAILFPDNQYSSFALIREEYEDAAPLMRAIIGQAQESSIERQAGIEDWLAHFLASAWPRSSTLVAEAVEAFGWDRDAGRIDEHAAVAFLNARLRSMHFMAELERPGHEWHEAYLELQKPGQRSRMPSATAGGRPVIDLLAYIRWHHPELEDHLDPNRVASYADYSQISYESNFSNSRPTASWGQIVVSLVILVVMVRLLAGLFYTEVGTGEAGMPSYSYAPDAWSDDEKQIVMDDLFGEGVRYVDLAQDAPAIHSLLSNFSNGNMATSAATELARSDLRKQVLNAASNASFEELVAIKQYELDLLRWLRQNQGAPACAEPNAWYGGHDVFAADPALSSAGRDLARRLLDAGMLREAPPPFPQTAAIPGEVVQSVMGRAGMTQEQFDRAARNEGDPESRCAYRIALLETILSQPGNVPADLLRIG